MSFASNNFKRTQFFVIYKILSNHFQIALLTQTLQNYSDE